MRPLEELVRPNIRTLKPYSTARDEFSGGEITTWLDANENPYDNGVNRYPDPHQKLLKQKIAALKVDTKDVTQDTPVKTVLDRLGEKLKPGFDVARLQPAAVDAARELR